MGYCREECFTCYSAGRGCNIQAKDYISDKDYENNNIYNNNVNAHPICFGCMYALSKSESNSYNFERATFKSINNVAIDTCSLCKRDKLCFTNITVCNRCRQQQPYQLNDGDDGYFEFENDDDYFELENEDYNEDDDDDFNEQLNEDEEIKFYNSKNALCFRCIDKIQFDEYILYPRNIDILSYNIRNVFVKTENHFKCDNCNESRWVRRVY